MPSYILLSNRTCQFQLLTTRSEVLLLLSVQTTQFDIGFPLKSENDVGAAALEPLGNTANAVGYVAYIKLDQL